MTERKFTRNLNSRGMAQQLRESVSKVIHQDLLMVCDEISFLIAQIHYQSSEIPKLSSIDIFFVMCPLHSQER